MIRVFATSQQRELQSITIAEKPVVVAVLEANILEENILN
jgi:hypothetical protein